MKSSSTQSALFGCWNAIYRVPSTMLEQRNILCVVLRFNLKYCTLCNDLMKWNKWLEFIRSCCALELKCCVVFCTKILYWKSTAAPAVGSSTLAHQCWNSVSTPVLEEQLWLRRRCWSGKGERTGRDAGDQKTRKMGKSGENSFTGEGWGVRPRGKKSTFCRFLFWKHP